MAYRCKGLCVSLKAPTTLNRIRYSIGQKRCSFCAEFFLTEDIRCPCCSSIMRTGPRKKKYE